MYRFFTPSDLITKLERASEVEKASGSKIEALRVFMPSLEEPPAEIFSEDYPLGDMIEPYDIEKEKDIIN